MIAMGFINPDVDILSELANDVENIPEKDVTVKETAIYSLCRLAGKLEDSEKLRKTLFRLLRDSGPDCKSVECQKRMVNCVAALGKDSYTKQLLQQVNTSQDKLAREMAIMALGKPGLVPDKMAKQVVKELLEIFVNEEQTTVDRLAAFNSVKLGEHF